MLEKLEACCTPRKSEVLHSYRFWNIPYTAPIHSFYTSLRAQAKLCNFMYPERMVQDKTVFSVDRPLQQLLLRESSLTLQLAIDMYRSFEGTHRIVQEMTSRASSSHRPTNPMERVAAKAREWQRFSRHGQRLQIHPNAGPGTSFSALVRSYLKSDFKSSLKSCGFVG